MNLHDIIYNEQGKCLYLHERMFKTIFGVHNNQAMYTNAFLRTEWGRHIHTNDSCTSSDAITQNHIT